MPVSSESETSLEQLFHPAVVKMLFFGFAAGLPILLIFSSLSLWLREAGLQRSAVTVFSWAALGYSFKFIWAPLVDRLSVPILTSWLGRRRSWILLAQTAIIAAIIWMAMIDPVTAQDQLFWMACAAVLLGFSSATQDIVIDAYRIESGSVDLQAMMSATYIAGYRIGMLVAGAGTLYLASWMGTSSEEYLYSAWRNAYLIMALCMLIGVATTLIVSEPEVSSRPVKDASNSDNLSLFLLFLFCVVGFIFGYTLTSDFSSEAKATFSEMFNNKALSGVLVEFGRLLFSLALAIAIALVLMKFRIVNRQVAVASYYEPIAEFFGRYPAKLAIAILALICLYRISDIVLGVVSNVFYQDLGFNKSQIAGAVKSFGLFMTIFGGFLGGYLSIRFGVLKVLLLGGLLACTTNLAFYLMAGGAPNINILYAVVAIDNLSAGLASAAFVAFLSALTNISFTAVQFAIFTSIMTLLPKILGGYSGSIVDQMGYPWFFMFTVIIGIPALLIILYVGRHVQLDEAALTKKNRG